MVIPKFILTGIHHQCGEKRDLRRTTHFRYSVEEAMIGGKNSNLFILLRLYAPFGIERYEVSYFSTTFGITTVGFLPLPCDVF